MPKPLDAESKVEPGCDCGCHWYPYKKPQDCKCCGNGGRFDMANKVLPKRDRMREMWIVETRTGNGWYAWYAHSKRADAWTKARELRAKYIGESNGARPCTAADFRVVRYAPAS